MYRSAVYIVILLLAALFFCSCSDNAASLDDDDMRIADVTLLVTPAGLGDNGYNDCAAEGVFAFAYHTNTPLSIMQPSDADDAEYAYKKWLDDNAGRDSAVLIMGSSMYETILLRHAAEDKERLLAMQKRGCRILLFESNLQIDGVTTVYISRYGISWLAGAMSKDFDALVYAASEGYSSLEESILGFTDARKTYKGEKNGTPVQTELLYLADGEDSFAMPDSAYRMMSRRGKQGMMTYDEMIFPLLGGSVLGLIRYLNDEELTAALMIGMDVDMTGLSSRIPFSMVIRIDKVLNQYLDDWYAGRDWQPARRFGMQDGVTDIVFTQGFNEHLVMSDGRYDEPGTFPNLYNTYKEEAIRKEAEYENR